MWPISLDFLLRTFWQIIVNWWWVFLPFFFWKPFLFLYLWWRVDVWLSQQRWILLEIKLPKEILKPVRAMEQVMASLQAVIRQPPDWWEKWIEGQIQLSLSFEIASIGGETHFYVRTPTQYRQAVESSLYSQYPEIEIKEVDDYTKNVPQSIPNQDWDMFGSDYRLVKEDYYPIKTYTEFETEREVLEEKRIDPIASLLEAMAKVRPGEQFWFQFLAEPITDANVIEFLGLITTKGALSVWLKTGIELRDRLARRVEEKKGKSMLREATEVLLTGKVAEEEEKKEEIIPPEMKLTPGEREILAALEKKMAKPVFNTTVRFIYLGKVGVFFKQNFRFAFAYFDGYNTSNLNMLIPNGKTLTKIHRHWFLPINLIYGRRDYLRCRKLFRNYINRFTPYFPRPGGNFALNVEELASLFHFPGRAVAPAPGLARIEAKKGALPSELPLE